MSQKKPTYAQLEKKLSDAEQALRDSLERRKRLFQDAPDAVFSLDTRGRFTGGNPAALRLFGCSEADLAGKGCEDFCHPDHLQRTREHLDTCLQGQPCIWQTAMLRQDNKPVDLSVSALPLMTRERVTGVFLIAREITDWKNTERKLREQKERLRLATESGGIGLWEYDLRTGEAVWSGFLYSLMGRDRDAPVTQYTFFEYIHTQERDRVRNRTETWFKEGGDFSEEFRVVREDGEVRWMAAAGRMYMDDDGRPMRAMGVNYDITERKQAAEALARERVLLERIVENIPVMMVIWDPNLKAFTLNSYATTVLGWTDADANRGDFMKRAYPDSAYRREVSRFMLSASGEWRELETTAKNGEAIPAAWTNIRLDDNTMIGIGMDLRERKRTEKELRRINETLESLVAERTDEVSQQADQLRALALQLSSTEQRERKRLADVLHDHIQQLIVASQIHLGLITDEYLPDQHAVKVREVNGFLDEAVNALRSLTVELFPPALHMTGLAGACTWLASDVKKKNQFELHIHAEEDAEPGTEELRFLLFECIRELVFNVIKHAGVREADVAVMRTADNAVQVIVSDMGNGFDPGLMKKRKAEDVTFGLFSIQQRLSHIGGVMEIETGPGKGTQITLTTAAGQVMTAAEETEAAEELEDAADALEVRRKEQIIRLLIVDDHKIMREGLNDLMRFEPDIHVVGEAATGEEAVTLAEELEPDVIIMDVNLGGMSGVEATRRILRRHPRIAVIGLSMNLDDRVRDAMYGAGAAAYLTKGGPSSDLIDAIIACRDETE